MSQLFGGKSKQKVQKVNDLKSVNRFVKWLTAKLNDLSENRFVKWLTAKFNNFSKNRVVKWVAAIIDFVLTSKEIGVLVKWVTAIIEFVSTFKQIGVLNGFGGEYKQKLLFVPDADNKPEDKHEISEVALLRFLIKEKPMEQLDAAEAETTQMQRILKDIDRNSKIVEFETHQSSMGSATDSSKAFHVFIVFKTTSKKDGVYWWSLEKNLEYIVLQRSRNKDNVKDKLDGGSREKNRPVKEGLKGKGAIKDLFTVLWAQRMIPEKYNIFNSNCQSLVTSVSKEITETGYEYQGVFKHCRPPKKDRDTEVLDLIKILRISSDWHPLFTLILIENTYLFDQITENGEYNMYINQEGMALLHYAIMFSKTKMVQHLLKPSYSVDPTRRDENGMNALDITAALTEQPEIIDLLLEHSKANKANGDSNEDTGGCWATAQKVNGMADVVNDRNEQGRTALHYATYASNEITAEHLIQKGADLHCRDNKGRTPLHVAARFAEDMNIIDVLLKNIRHAEEMDHYKKGATLLTAAMQNQNELGQDIIGRLVAKGYVSNELVQNPPVLEALPSRRSKSNEHDVGGANWTEDKGAVGEGTDGSEYFKIRKGSNFKADFGIARIIGDNAAKMEDKVNQVLQMVLSLAIANSNVKNARKLVKEFGVDISTLTWGKEKRSALHLASQYAKTNMIDFILEKGKLDINGADNRRATPLHYAVVGFHAATNARYLLEKGADPTIRDNKGFTPFHTAAAFSRESDILHLLLANNKKFDIDHRNQFGRTALHMAISKSNTATAETLLSKGANPNAADEDGRTPLHLAALLAKDEDLIDLLLNAEAADVNCVDKKGRTPLACARDNKNGLVERIISRLKERGAKE